MSTDLCFGNVPVFYEEIFEICSLCGSSVPQDVYNLIFKQTNIKSAQINAIISILNLKKNPEMSRSSLYKCLALIAWAQQGKELTEKLFDNFAGVDLPIPTVSNISFIKKAVGEKNIRLHHQGIIYSDLLKIDTISIELVPEKKGLFLKHSEYIIISQRFRSSVRRRYNDFLALHEILSAKYPYRLIPRLPPKKVVVTSAEARFLEERRRSLSRWSNLVARHPTLSSDAAVEYFFTEKEHELLRYKIRELFGKSPDEFMTSAQNEQLVNEQITPEMARQFTKSQEHISVIYHGLKKMKQVFDRVGERHEAHASDMNEVGNVLLSLGAIASAPHITNSSWENTKQGLVSVAGEFNRLGAMMETIGDTGAIRTSTDAHEGLLVALDGISGARDLFRRLGRGVHAERAAVASTGSLPIKTSLNAQEEILRARGVFAMRCVEQEAALALAGLVQVGAAISWLAHSQAYVHKQMAYLWDEIETSLLSRNFSVCQQPNGSNAQSQYS